MTLLCASIALAAWAEPGCAFRKTVEIICEPPDVSQYPRQRLPRGVPESPRAVKAIVSLEGQRPGSVRVYCGGKSLPRSVVALEGTELHEVAFPYSGESYEIYFGGGGSFDDDYFPQPSGLFLETFRHPTGVHPQSIEQMLELLGSVSKSWGRGPRACIDDNENPFGYDDDYVSFYQGYVLCPSEGRYAFSINSDDCAFLLIDGNPVVSWAERRPHMPAFGWKDSRSGGIDLRKGLHLLTCYHSELRGSQRMRVGWRPPGDKETRLVPPSAFVDALPAELVSFEERRGEGISRRLCFTERTAERRAVNGKFHARLVELRATFDAGEDTSFRWDSAGRTAPGSVARFWVDSVSARGLKLTAFRGGDVVAEYERKLTSPPPDPAEEDALAFLLDVRQAPSLAYEDERALAVLAIIGGEGSAELVFEAQDDSGRALAGGEVNSQPHSWDAFDVPLEDTSKWVLCAVGLGGAAEERVRFRMFSSRGDWPRLAETGGTFFTPDGARAVIFIPRERDVQYRRWAPIRWLKSSSMRPSGALFAGDSCDGMLSSFLASKGVTLACAESSLGLLLALENALTNETGKVVIFPGSMDFRAGTSVVEFGKVLDASIDRIRRVSPHARVTVATPIPDPAREGISVRMAEEARRIAAEHHVRLFDVHALVTSARDWKESYAERGVYSSYPVRLMDKIIGRVERELF